MRIIDMNYFFSGDFQGQEGGCALCTNAHYTTLNTVIKAAFKQLKLRLNLNNQLRQNLNN